jgi:hypothetical protein
MKGTYQKNRTAVIALAALAWLGVLLQLYLSLHSAIANGKGLIGGVVSYFGYFTILTNIGLLVVQLSQGVNAVGLLMAFIMLGMILVALGRIQRRANA